MTSPPPHDQPQGHDEDRFLTGAGRFLDDRTFPDCGHAVFVRSPFARARLLSIDTTLARGMAGVRCVLTADDLQAAGLRPLRCQTVLEGQSDLPYPVIAGDTVSHVGQIVAMVVADTQAQARDAAEAVFTEFDEETPVIGTDAALAPGAAAVHASVPGNVAFEWRTGDGAATEDAFAKADHQVIRTVLSNRVAINPMETRGAVAAFDEHRDLYTLHTPTQGVHVLRNDLADNVLGIDREKLRVVTEDVGGAFGMKMQTYPEHVLTLFAARTTGRPVRWIADRSESFLADVHGRAQTIRGELALDGNARILGLRLTIDADMGSHLSSFASVVPTISASKVTGHTYRVPCAEIRTRGVLTNTVPVDSYRGAGKPEVVYALERLLDEAARQLRMDPVDLRRANLVQPSDLPYETATGETLESGDFPKMLDTALERSGAAHRERRRQEARSRGLLYGFGIGFYIHATGSFTGELSRLDVRPEGHVDLYTGSQSGGQGHAATFASLVGERLGIGAGRVRVLQGDTDWLDRGAGTGGSTAAPIVAVNLARTADFLVENGRELASHALEASAADIEFCDGGFRVVGTDRQIGLFELAAFARSGSWAAPVEQQEFAAYCGFTGPHASYPNGCHVAEVEVDPETGRFDIVSYTAIDDTGTLLNEDRARGQIVGAIAQAQGQAIGETVVFDGDNGQLLTGSFMDYYMPRAADLPAVRQAFLPHACTVNPLGVKGAGENGCIGGLAPVVNAVLDALGPMGVVDIQMPLTSHAIWQAIRSVSGPAPAD